MRVGNVVYFDRIVFRDNVIEEKQNRPCIVLYEYEHQGKNYLLCVPVMTSVITFNKYYFNYVLIPEPLYDYKEFYFAKIDNLFIEEEALSKDANITLCNNSLNVIKERVINYHTSKPLYGLFHRLKEIEDLECKNSKKLSKNY